MGSVVLFADGTVAGTVDDVVVTADGSQQVIVQIADDVNTEADRFALTVDASASASSEITLGQTRAEFLTLMQAQMSTEG